MFIISTLDTTTGQITDPELVLIAFRLKFGDRFFYDFGHDEVTRFTPEQLQEIRKVTMARLICTNSNGKISKIQPRAFEMFDLPGNAMVSCTDTNKIPDMILDVFTIPQ